MFYNCIHLKSAPALPAKELSEYCYFGMFTSCISLTEAPDLYAPIVKKSSYYRMFADCRNLKSIKVGFSDWYNLSGWMQNVAKKGTFTCPAELPKEFSEDKIPEGWKVEKLRKK